ncbi:fatty-acyl-CoA synthase [Murinocardiopsis flavida]|uniref:Fatty-acyl-CoA synthase n=1 Tax=Murinocardiopsis flavida TaxID=645275 RepID=A0A2P8CWS9_9ACTN|nr:fatty acid--CoA ligase family protein [Murinocardiopsis flavida]PSK89434.1 fatty-acyl-CoA synthase [Murinocardiopsis flavida]
MTHTALAALADRTDRTDRTGRTDRIVLRDDRDTFTAGRALDTVHRLARALCDRGLGPGGTAALMGPVSTRMYLLLRAIELTGAAQVELPLALAVPDQVGLAAACRATHVVADPAATDPAAVRSVAALPGVRLLALAAPGPGEDVFAAAEALPAEPFASRARPGDPGRISLTGGTTGRAKPVLRRHRPLRPFSARWLEPLLTGGPVRMLKTDRLTGLGLALGDATLVCGGEFTTLPEFTPEAALSAVRRLGVTHMVIAPHQLRGLVEHPGAAEGGLASLRCVISATAATGPALLKRAVAVLGPIVHPTYGQTESGNITRLSPDDYAGWDPAVTRSCGRPVPGAHVEVRDPQGRTLPEGRRGHVWVRTPQLMDEYLDRPEDTGRVLRDGLLDTGDIGYQDARGFLTVLGRSGDAMVVNGGTVFASEVDTVLQEHPGVREAATFDVHGDGGATLHTAVAPRPGADVTEGELRELLAPRLDPRHMPSSFMFVSRIPLTYAHERCPTTLRHWHAARASERT